jgi:subtilisin family serine protease
MLFVASAGNAATNNDTSASRSIPASFDLPNVLSVAAIDNRGGLASFSNYGATTVDIAAPGVDILSTFPEYHGEAGHAYLSGTSMAAPHVTGIAALAGSQTPSLLTAPTALKSRILTASKARGGTAGKTVTGRIADAAYAVDLVAPTAQPPSRFGFVAGTTIGTTIRTRVKWTAGADALSGIGSYAVRQAINGGAWSTIVSSTTALQLDRSLTVATTSRFQVRARDRAGNTGAFVDGPLIRPTLTQQTSGALRYSGTWSSSASSSASGGSTRFATRAGASVSFAFTGRSIGVVAPRSSTRGSVKVYVDGIYVGAVSTYRSSAQSRVVIYARDWGSVATHTIKLVVAGTAGHPRFDLDAFAVLK